MQATDGLLSDRPGGAARIVGGAITGIGFIGGGAIVKHGTSVLGTATAAALFATGAVGIAVRLADVIPALVAHVAASASLAGAASGMAGYDDTSYRIRLMALVRGFVGVAD